MGSSPELSVLQKQRLERSVPGKEQSDVVRWQDLSAWGGLTKIMPWSSGLSQGRGPKQHRFNAYVSNPWVTPITTKST